MNRRRFLSLSALTLGAAACGRKDGGSGKPLLRVGHFPNITHAQGVIASQLSRDHKGWFEERLPGVEFQWYAYNAGPAAMEALFADSIDLTYIGPSPVLNGYAKAGGEEVRVIAGSAAGGAGLVVKANGGPTTPAAFKGLRIATPQYGNTQDISCRVWLRRNGFTITQSGGDANVLPTPNPDQLSLFQRGELDAVWTVEPWISRLELEAGGKLFLEQKEEIITVLAASVQALEKKKELLTRFVAAHKELTTWVSQHGEEAQALVRQGVNFQTHTDLPAATVAHAWPRLHFAAEIERASFEKSLAEAQSVGLLKDCPKLDRLMSPLS